MKTEFSIADGIRRANLPYYDYKDIHKISTHFDIIGNNLEVKNDRFPSMVFKHCWEKYRRHLTTLLPVTINVAKESFEITTKTNRELFGTKIKKQRIRSAISLFLGRIALLNFSIVEDYIVDLITLKNDGAVSIAARAISHIYYNGNEENKNEIKSLLNNWLNTGSIPYKSTINLLKEELQNKEDDKTIPDARLQILIAYILMHLFNQCTPNEVPSDLKKLLLNLLKCSSAEVRRNLVTTVLSSIYSLHFAQFHGDIDDFICKYSMYDSFSTIIAKNFRKNYEITWKLLDSWFARQETISIQLTETDKEKLIMAGINTLEKIYEYEAQYENDKGKITTILNKMITEEKSIEIKTSALELLVGIASKNTTDLDKEIQESIHLLNSDERQYFIETISRIYLSQRKKQTGGDIKEEIDGKSYELWLDPNNYPRPNLPIEKMLDKWLQEATTKEAAQLAYLAQASFIKIFEKKEKEIIEKIQEERQYDNNDVEYTLSEIIEDHINNIEKIEPYKKIHLIINNWYAELISIPIGVARKYPAEEKTIRAILPVLLLQDHEERNSMLDRFYSNRKWELAESIKSIIRFDKNKFFVIILSIIIIFILLILAKP
jgi:hypothetical protein